MIDFDAAARDWDSDPEKVERAQRVADGIAASVPLSSGVRAFEYGGGTGLLSFALRDHVGSIVVADRSRGMLDVLRAKIQAVGASNMTALLLDLTRETAPPARFDLVCTLMTMHHVPDTDVMLAKFAELLVPRGFLAIADLDAEDGSFHGPEFDGHRGFDRQSLAAQAGRAGFVEPRFSTVFTLTRSTGGVERQYPMFLFVARKRG
jgi:ubiquinone/menaquinone biosynthesis C-methylase UbiE